MLTAPAALHGLSFDGDGKSDILWQNDNGTPAIWLMDGRDVRCAGRRPVQSGADWQIKGLATSTATASRTSCGRTTTARRRSG